jgi:hypothetical protein
MNYDWTYTTDYKGAIEKMGSSSGFKGPEPAKAEINVALLKKPDPILWYQHLVLFEDELHDNGVSTCFLKVRVMPSCFLVLLRFWLRVDGVLIRLRDTRLFHEFDTDYVLREYQAREESFESLVKRGLPKSSAYYKDPDAISKKIRVVDSVMEKITLVKPANSSTSSSSSSSVSSASKSPSLLKTDTVASTSIPTATMAVASAKPSAAPTSTVGTSTSTSNPSGASSTIGDVVNQNNSISTSKSVYTSTSAPTPAVTPVPTSPAVTKASSSSSAPIISSTISQASGKK